MAHVNADDSKGKSDLEPNPDVLQELAPNVQQPLVMQMQQEQAKLPLVVNDAVQMQKHDQLSVEEHASTLLGLHHQILQEQEQLTQKDKELLQGQPTQQQHIEGQAESFQMCTVETEHLLPGSTTLQLKKDNVIMEEQIDSDHQVLLKIGHQQLVLSENVFFTLFRQSLNRDSNTISSEKIEELINTWNDQKHQRSIDNEGEMCEQQQIVKPSPPIEITHKAHV